MARIRGRIGTMIMVMSASAGAILTCAPSAGAEPDPGQNCQQQQPQDGDQQPCDQGPGMPNLPKAPNDNGQQKQGRLSDYNCWMYPTGPVWVAPGAMPPPAPVGVQVPPCYSALGLQPTVPGM